MWPSNLQEESCLRLRGSLTQPSGARLTLNMASILGSVYRDGPKLLFLDIRQLDLV